MSTFDNSHQLLKPAREHLKVYRESAWKEELEQAWGSFRVAGVDLGQACDHAAISILKRTTYKGHFCGPPDPSSRLVYCRRWPNDTDYMDLAEELVSLNPNVMVLEFNGVGRPVVDIVRSVAQRRGYVGKIRPVITAASNARMEEHREARGSYMTVPKKDIVSAIRIMGKARLLVTPSPKRMPELKHLDEELRVFQMRYSQAGNMQFGNQPGAGLHDDLVISLGLACWWMLRCSGQNPGIAMGGL